MTKPKIRLPANNENSEFQVWYLKVNRYNGLFISDFILDKTDKKFHKTSPNQTLTLAPN